MINRTKITLLILFTLSISCILVTVFVKVHQKTIKEKTNYAIVIDAGSTGSRLHIFYWETPNGFDTPYIEEMETFNETEPGISDCLNNLTQIDFLIGNLLDAAIQFIPQENHQETPVFLKATAGMRLLSKQNQDIIIQKCQDVVSKYPFLYNPQEIQVISGEDEGLYGWISINYLAGNFLNYVENKVTYGSLDLGGASTQIAFIPKENQLLYNYSKSVHINSTDYILYSTSFLGYGITESNIDVIDYLISQNEYLVEDVIQSPCFPLGLNANFCRTNGDDCRTINGTGNFSQCSDIIKQAKFPNASCQYPHCSINGTFQPEVTDYYYATSVYYYVNEFFFGNSNNTSSIQDIQQQGIAYCNLTFSEIINKYGNDSDLLPFLEIYCFDSAYLTTLLHSGFGFQTSGQQTINKVDSINGISVSWTLGAIIAENQFFEYSTQSSSSRFVTKIPGIILVSFFSLFIVVLLILYCRLRSKSKKSSIYHFSDQDDVEDLHSSDDYKFSHIDKYKDEEIKEENLRLYDSQEIFNLIQFKSKELNNKIFFRFNFLIYNFL
ncbi:adenosine/guanosine diphosphatase [Anaeramoeba ignava]|uniref:Adenosine/guanosine diphosphatase n=1 Tax=Anaeramoeba ignava TaxID=1746090 RepID=A0A9Q0L9U9_ANAIG|nr:adenosine/guanosine diphosphatase [Anaeramoeba ignava]